MRKWIFGVLFLLGLPDGRAQDSQSFPIDSSIRRLDGSSISSKEVDAKELLETLLKNAYTPIEWEGYAPYNSSH